MAGSATGPPAHQGIYGISVAAELTGAGIQTLRMYEQRGLLDPQRTSGGTRRYSRQDLARVHRITVLLEGGLNLAGVSQVMDLEDENEQLKQALKEARS